LTPEERGLLDRVRRPAAERFAKEVTWLRTCYEPSTDTAFSDIVSKLEDRFGGEVIILNDPTLYDFGADWHKIFLRIPQLLEFQGSADGYNKRLQKTLQEVLNDKGEDSEEYKDDYTVYHWTLVVGRIHVVDGTTLATEGRNAGKVRIVFYDECDRVVRSYSAEVDEAADITSVDNYILNEHGCWVHGRIGKDYKWGAPLGPPYDQVDSDETDSEGSADDNE
jgi:hypothetical protein